MTCMTTRSCRAGWLVALRDDGRRLRAGLSLLPALAADSGPDRGAAPAIYRFLLNKWYFDELYDLIFVRPSRWLGRFLWKKGDGMVIDGFGPDGISALSVKIAGRVMKLQTGYVYHYALAMLLGVAGFVTWYLYSGGAH